MRRALSLVFSYYPSDPRVRREAEALVENNCAVDLICLRGEGELKSEIVRGVHVHRLGVARSRGGKLSYILEYGIFSIMAFLKISYCSMGNRFHLVHVHNMPDFLVFAALLPRLFGARIILDLHDPMPEVYMAKYGFDESHFFIKFLKNVEKYSIGFSHMVLTPNKAFRELFIKRGCPRDKIHIVMNTPQENVFFESSSVDSEAGQPAPEERFRVMYHGTLVERHGLDTALEALVRVRKEIPQIVFDVFGDGDYVKAFLEKVRTMGLEDVVNYYGHVPQETIAKKIEQADLGIIPNKLSRFTSINFPTRIFEYLCYRKPVIVPRTPGIMDYFGEDEIFYFIPNNVSDLTDLLLKIYSGTDTVSKVVERGHKVYRNHSWARERKHFVDLVSTL